MTPKKVDIFRVTGMADCPEHGEHSDWYVRSRGLWCALCKREAYRRFIARNHEGSQTYQNEWRRQFSTTLQGVVTYAVIGAKGRAAKAGLDFDIDREWVLDRIEAQQGKCLYTGIPFDLATNNGRPRPLVPSLDRRDPGKGYVMDNVEVVCWMANRAKSNLSLEDFIDLCRAVAETADERG